MLKLLGLFGIMAVFSSVQAADLQDCDQLYAHRGTDALLAADCYQQIAVATDAGTDLQKRIYERSFIALSAVVNDWPKTKAERDAIDRGLQLVKEFAQIFKDSADLPYWRACMVSFDVFQKDRGAVIPTHTFRALGEIQSDLRLAIQRDSSIHFYGPLRVLGMMHTQMPAIAGGDKTLAEKLLKEAYQRAANFSMNHLAFARILDVNGKTDEAVSVLQQMLALPDASLDPFSAKPLLSLLPEVQKDKKAAQVLLDDLSE
jgi:hypothetical protein